MKILMISTDWRIAVLGSNEHMRMSNYATITEELHIIVFTKKEQNLSPTMSGNLYIYPTNSNTKLAYGHDAYKIASRLRKQGITVVTAQDPFETGMVGYKISRMIHAGLQLQMHTDWFSPYYAAESLKNKIRVRIANFLVPKASGIRVVSQRLKNLVMQRFPLAPEPVVLPIHLDIPVTMLSNRSDFIRKKYPQFAFSIIMVSRLESEKNVLLAFNAFRNIAIRNPGVGLIVVGDGSMRPVLERAVIAADFKEKAVFEGWQDNRIPYFLSANLFINPSNYEGYGRTLIEAAAAGCPILTTDVGVVGEVLNETNALITPVGDLQSFENNLEYAIRHPAELTKKAELAREAVTHYMSFTENDRLMILKKSWEASEQGL